MRAARLKELEEMAAKLLEIARKLPPGQDRHNALQEIGSFCVRITRLQRQKCPTDLALQLPFLKISESMGNHDSKIVDVDSVD
jgi:hypothetical protein